ncbi:MAG: DMT family transporter [Bacteroidota bacterium]|nr:DMT family transporter [Kiloniellaceae bacterium]
MNGLSDNARGAIFMAICMAGFVLNDAMIKLATQEVSLFQAIFLRGILASLLIGALAWWRRQLIYRVSRGDGWLLALRIFGEMGGTVCYLTALMHIPIANATAILQALPLAVTLGAAVFLKEPVGWKRYTAIAIGFAGVLIIVRPGAEGFDAFALLAVVAVGFVTLRDLATRQLSGPVPSLFVAFGTAVAIMLFGAVMLPFTEWKPVAGRDLLHLTIAAGALFFGYVFSVSSVRVGEVAFVAPFRYTILIWAILLGVVIFGDIPDGWTLLGAGIIVATGVFTFYRERRLARRPVAAVALETAD